jgi:hypothetical protein
VDGAWVAIQVSLLLPIGFKHGRQHRHDTHIKRFYAPEVGVADALDTVDSSAESSSSAGCEMGSAFVIRAILRTISP